MTKILTNKRYGPIGLELQDRSLQMIQFSADQSKVLDAVRWDLPSGHSQMPADARDAELVRALVEARAGRKFRGREVMLCLGASDLFVQNIRVVKGPAQELQKTIQQEAAQRLPYPISEAEIRYFCAGDVRQGDQTKREVILLACQRSVIDRALAIIDRAGLRAIGMEIEPSAMLRAYLKQARRDIDRAQRAIYVRLSANNSTVVIAQGTEVYFVKYLDLCGNMMDEAVADHLKISREEAAMLRRHNGDRRADQQDPDVARSVNEATRATIERLISEVSLCVRYHSVTFRGQQLGRLVLGGSEATQSLVDLLSMRLDVKCELGDPLRSFDAALPTTRRAGWDVATGLALRGLPI